ncbi:hypothetical protein B0H19DRAFT_1194550 [Mycena capillaripes]|nr:hypothetical protein B0H19DRAFT_1194550 [Mycena capillaripes]
MLRFRHFLFATSLSAFFNVLGTTAPCLHPGLPENTALYSSVCHYQIPRVYCCNEQAKGRMPVVLNKVRCKANLGQSTEILDPVWTAMCSFVPD